MHKLRRQRWVVWIIASVTAIAIALTSQTNFISIIGTDGRSVLAQSPPSSFVMAQSPTPRSPSASPSSPTLPSTTPPITSPTGLPVPPAPPPLPPASTAPPLPLAAGKAGTYFDPAGSFKVGVLSGYRVSPLAGSVLIEATNGNLAYTVVAQSQPIGNPIGLTPSFLNSDTLAQVATTVFQRGEGFQPGPIQAEAGGGAVMNWTGSLTIAGQTQSVGGVILVRPTSKNILLLLISATQAGSSQVQGALSALANTLQPL